MTDLERSAAIPLCKHFHQSTRELSEQFASELGRHNYVTPTSYLELISSFKSVLANKRGDVLKMKKRYEVGLEKLKFAASQVIKFFIDTSPVVIAKIVVILILRYLTALCFGAEDFPD